MSVERRRVVKGGEGGTDGSGTLPLETLETYEVDRIAHVLTNIPGIHAITAWRRYNEGTFVEQHTQGALPARLRPDGGGRPRWQRDPGQSWRAGVPDAACGADDGAHGRVASLSAGEAEGLALQIAGEGDDACSEEVRAARA